MTNNYDLWKSDVGPWPSIGDHGDVARSPWFRPALPLASQRVLGAKRENDEPVVDLTEPSLVTTTELVLDLTDEGPTDSQNGMAAPDLLDTTAEADPVLDLTDSPTPLTPPDLPATTVATVDRHTRAVLVAVHDTLTPDEQRQLALSARAGDRLSQQLLAALEVAEEDMS